MQKLALLNHYTIYHASEVDPWMPPHDELTNALHKILYRKNICTIQNYKGDFLYDWLNSFEGYEAYESRHGLLLYSQKDNVYYCPFYTAVYNGREYHIAKDNGFPYMTRVVVDMDEWEKYLQVYSLLEELINPGFYIEEKELNNDFIKGVIYQHFGPKIFENIVISEEEYINNFKSKHFERYIIHNPCSHKKMCYYRMKLNQKFNFEHIYRNASNLSQYKPKRGLYDSHWIKSRHEDVRMMYGGIFRFSFLNTYDKNMTSRDFLERVIFNSLINIQRKYNIKFNFDKIFKYLWQHINNGTRHCRNDRRIFLYITYTILKTYLQRLIGRNYANS